MSANDRHPALSGPGIMLLSAAIFGYFGFTTIFNHHSVITGQFLLFVALLDWTLKVTAITFVVCAALTFARPLEGNLLYSAAGMLSAILFLVVAVLDFADTQHTVISPIILILFAAWNGAGSWSGLKMAMALREESSRREMMEPPAGP